MHPTDSTPTPGIPPDLYRRIRVALLQCDALQSHETTRALFVEEPLASWRYGVREANTMQDRIAMLMDFLHDQWTVGGENALVLLLRALAALTGSADALGPRLAALATELAGEDRAATLPHDPQARLEALPTEQVPEVSLSLPPGSRMPFRPNPLFVGREEDLKVLAHTLKGEVGAVVIGQSAAVTGLGGVGKTQTAAEFAWRYGLYFAGGVFWLSFAEAEGIKAEIAACGATLQLGADGLTLDEQVQLVLKSWEQPIPRLLIFDNCEEEALFTEWRPKMGGCRVLLTSRRPKWAATLGVQRLALGVLERAESVTLLASYHPDLAGQSVLAEIAEELGDLPLALHLAGSYLESYQGGDFGDAEQYLARLRDKGLLQHPSLQGRGATHSPTDHELHVGRTFALSYERLDPTQRVDALAQQLLARAAHFAWGEPIPRALLLATLEPGDDEETLLDAEDALRRLLNLGLVEQEGAGGLVIHRLVAMFALSIGNSEKAQEVVERVLLWKAKRINREGYPALLLAWQSHLRAVTNQAMHRENERAAGLCNELGYHLDWVGDYSGAIPYLERSLAICEKIFEPNHPDTATTLDDLGRLCYEMGDYAPARSYLERSLSICEKIFEPNHIDIANTLNSLGQVLGTTGEYGVARTYLERALAICEQVLGPNHPNTSATLNNLGMLLHAMGDYAAARTYLERALVICEQVLGPDHPDTATSLNNLGILLHTMGDYAAARPYHERALVIWEQVLGPDHPDTATSLNNLGNLLHAMGDYAAARPYYERALAICEQVLGPDHPDTAFSLNNLGGVLYVMGNYAAAHPYLERALAIWEQVLGPKHPNTALSLNNLGNLLYAMGNYAAARTYLERALAIWEQVLGPDHPDTAQSLNNLGIVLHAMGDYVAARSYLERALASRLQVLGSEHPNTRAAHNNLAALLKILGED